MQKDLRLALQLAEEFEHPLPITASTNEVFKHAKHLGYSDHDVSAVYIRSRFWTNLILFAHLMRNGFWLYTDPVDCGNMRHTQFSDKITDFLNWKYLFLIIFLLLFFLFAFSQPPLDQEPSKHHFFMFIHLPKYTQTQFSYFFPSSYNLCSFIRLQEILSLFLVYQSHIQAEFILFLCWSTRIAKEIRFWRFFLLGWSSWSVWWKYSNVHLTLSRLWSFRHCMQTFWTCRTWPIYTRPPTFIFDCTILFLDLISVKGGLFNLSLIFLHTLSFISLGFYLRTFSLT